MQMISCGWSKIGNVPVEYLLVDEGAIGTAQICNPITLFLELEFPHDAKRQQESLNTIWLS